jgi:hypothetical protein
MRENMGMPRTQQLDLSIFDGKFPNGLRFCYRACTKFRVTCRVFDPRSVSVFTDPAPPGLRYPQSNGDQQGPAERAGNLILRRQGKLSADRV